LLLKRPTASNEKLCLFYLSEINLTMKTKIALFVGLLLTANVSFAELKIGYVDMRTVLEKAPQAEKATKRMEMEFSPRQKQLVAQEKDIQTKEERMSRDAAVMGEAERSNLEKDILNKKETSKDHNKNWVRILMRVAMKN